MERTTLLRNLKPLVDEGLVAIGPARAGRANVARLTARGTKALERARPYWRSAQNALRQRVGGDDVERVLAVAAALAASAQPGARCRAAIWSGWETVCWVPAPAGLAPCSTTFTSSAKAAQANGSCGCSP